MKSCHALPIYFTVLRPRSEVVLFGKNRRGKDGNRHVAGYMRCVNVHPCLEHVLWPYRACHKATAHACNWVQLQRTKECSWNSKEICNGSKLGCRSKVVESHCQLLSRWNSFAHRSVLLGYIMFDFIQNNRKCIPCNTKVLIPLFTVKRTVSQYKPVIRIRNLLEGLSMLLSTTW